MNLKKEVGKGILFVVLFILTVLLFLNTIFATPQWVVTPVDQANLSEDTLFTLYLNASDNETGHNASLNYSDDTHLFDITQIAADPVQGLISFTPTVSDIGNYTIVFVVRDSNDNVITAVVHYNVTAVNDAPNISGITNQTIAENGNPTDNWIDLWDFASDEEQNDSFLNFTIVNQTSLALIDCSLVSDKWINCSSPLANTSGVSDLNVSVTDGNLNATALVRITVTEVSQPSVITVDYPNGGETVSGTIYVNATATDVEGNETVQNVSFFYNRGGGSWIFIGADYNNGDTKYNFSWNTNVSSIPDSSDYQIRAVADDGNNTASDTSNGDFTIDNPRRPVVNVVYPNQGENVSGVIILNATVEDPDDNTSIRNASFYYSVDGSSWTFIGTDFNVSDTKYNVSWNTSGISDGTNYSIRVNSTDSNLTGNDTSDGVFRIDNTYPLIYGDSKSLSTIYSNSSVSFFINATDTYVRDVWIEANFTGSYNNYTIGVNVSERYNYTASSANFSNQFNVTWRFWVDDYSGNKNNTDWDSFIVQNNPPTFSGNISRINWTQGTIYTGLDLDTYFSDVDGDSLTYSYVSNITSISVSVNQNNGVVSLTPVLSFYGVRYIVFNVSDSYGGSALSNNVTLVVNESDYCGDGICGSGETCSSCSTDCGTCPATAAAGGGGGGSSRTRKVSMELTVPEFPPLVDGDKIITKLYLENTGDIDLENVDLSYLTNIEGLILEFLDKTIPKLKKGEKFSTDLIIMSTGLSILGNENYKIELLANGSKPVIADILDIYISFAKGAVAGKINFAQDLFKENPKCLELNELLIKAQSMLNMNNLREAKKLTEEAIDGCTDLVTSSSESLKMPVKREMKWGIFFIVIIILSLCFFVIGYLIREFKKTKVNKGKNVKWRFKNEKTK